MLEALELDPWIEKRTACRPQLTTDTTQLPKDRKNAFWLGPNHMPQVIAVSTSPTVTRYTDSRAVQSWTASAIRLSLAREGAEHRVDQIVKAGSEPVNESTTGIVRPAGKYDVEISLSALPITGGRQPLPIKRESRSQ
jgi:hypothetical protein